MSPEAGGLLTLAELEEAAAGLRGVAVRTPLLESPALSDAAGVPVYLKLENQQPTGAFKLRGAWTALRRLPEEQRKRGVITYSSGNHGQALAFAAKRMGIRAVIVMPETAPAAKVEGVKRWDGEVVFAGTTSEDRYEKAMLLAREQGLAVIPPFDHRDIVAGQGTVGLEILDQLPEVTDIAAPVGGGGLAGGIAAALRARQPKVRLTAVEPEGAAALKAALAAGRPVRLERTFSVADGLLPLAVGAIPFLHLRDFAHSVTVSEAAIVEATRWLCYQQKLVVEPSGAVTTAALRSGAFRPSGPTVLVVSGGNIDPAAIAQLA
ncbi:MAG: hydroxyectoine utilization dehydratase EutB [Gemmatimonadales bacterium]|nr:MAG: hydroxyectoine utilization dehydratase EutB [Gemmatimonadales bacterium]